MFAMGRACAAREGRDACGHLVACEDVQDCGDRLLVRPDAASAEEAAMRAESPTRTSSRKLLAQCLARAGEDSLRSASSRLPRPRERAGWRSRGRAASSFDRWMRRCPRRCARQPRRGECRWEWTMKGAATTESLVTVWRDDRGLVASTARGERVRRGADGRWVAAETVSGTRAEVQLSVHEVERKLWLRREHDLRATLAYGDTVVAHIGNTWWPVERPNGMPPLAIAAPEHAGPALIVSAQGSLSSAR